MQTKTYNGATYVQDPRTGEWVRVPSQQQAPQPQTPQVVVPAPPPPPPAPPQAPGRTIAGAATEGLKQGYAFVNPNNPAEGQYKIPTTVTPGGPTERERGAQIKEALAAIQIARTQADEMLAIGSTSQFLQGVPGINQNRLNIESTLRNAEAGIIQDMVRSLAEANGGGVSGMANTATEAQRMGAAIADLNANQDLPSLLTQLERAEQYYLRQAATAEGKAAPDQDIIDRYLPETRRKELGATPETAPTGLATDGKTQVPVPPAMQQALTRYLLENQNNLDPSQYAAFYNDLSEKFGMAPRNLSDSVEKAKEYQQFFRDGGDPAAIQIAPPERETSFLEGLASRAANTGLGAGVASATNSALAGIPALLAGKNEEMEAVRQNSPVASFAGDLAGSVAGTVGVGGLALKAGARGIAANPMVQNALFGGVSGATQSEDPLLGAGLGVATSFGGDLLGRQIGRALPGVFARNATREAAETVPTSGELGIKADELYRRAMSQGQVAPAARMDEFIDETEAFMRANNIMTPQGDIIGTGPLQETAQLLRSFRGRDVTPLEAKALREKIAEGRMAMKEGAPDNRARMLSGDLTQQFDRFAEADGIMPGIADARAEAQKRIMGRELERARELGTARGEINYSQGGADLGIRRAYGALDTAEIRGSKMYPEEVSKAIEKVSRGTPARNAAQWLGRFSPQGGTGIASSGGIGLLAGTATDPVTGAIAGGTMAAMGLLGRTVASGLTRNDANMAELVARGGPEFQALLRQAEEEAAIRGGRFGSGLFGSAAIMPFRD